MECVRALDKGLELVAGSSPGVRLRPSGQAVTDSSGLSYAMPSQVNMTKVFTVNVI